jgi:hypothetical protein
LKQMRFSIGMCDREGEVNDGHRYQGESRMLQAALLCSTAA